MEDYNMMNIISRAKKTLEIEASSIMRMLEHLDKNFEDAVAFLFSTKGRVITSGIGKSGHIARKAAATFASTGTPSFFVDPVECMHGDFGMITKDDVMILYSKSGEVSEMSNMVNWLLRQAIPYIAITNEINSFIAKHAHITLLIYVEKEACPLNLAPTASSTVSLALSDALATSLMELHNFDKYDFAKFHPGGDLGKQATTIEHIMHTNDLPIVDEHTKLNDSIDVMIKHKLGVLLVLDGDILKGILVDGDFKRILSNSNDIGNILKKPVSEVMNVSPVTVAKDDLIGDALSKMEGRITSLIVVEDSDEGRKLLGVLHIHDILKYKAI